jgi:NAD(P)-dependent dehydrogenase (short-subunit alcohol dehydrogenase family)
MTGLAGRVALVSGALRGIGLAISERYLREGARVVLADLAANDSPDVTATLECLGPSASYVMLDVTQEQHWRQAEQQVRAAHQRLDILVNNAGIECTGAVETLELESWRRLMSVNLDGVFLGIKVCTPLLAASGARTPYGSSIINMSSVMGMVGYSEAAAYNASKGGVRLLTKSVAIEFAHKRTPIRVNSIHPGFVRTPMLEISMRKFVERGMAESAQQLIDGIAAATPNGRLAEAVEIAGAAYFLASDDSSYCTGSELVIDGGWTAQ